MLYVLFDGILNQMTFKKLLRNKTAFVFLIRIMGAALGLISSVILSRYLGISDVGYYYFAMSIVTILSSLSSMGYGNVIIKHCTNSGRYNEKLIKSYILRFCFFSVLRSSVIASVLFYFSSFYLIKYQVVLDANWIISFSLVLSSINVIAVAFLQSQEKIVYSVFLQYILQPCLLVFSVSAVTYYNNIINFNYAIVCFFFSVFVVSAFYMWMIYPQFLLQESHINKGNFKFDKAEQKDYLISNTLGMIITQSYVFFSGIFVQSSDVAIVAISDKLTLIINILAVSITSVLAPKISKSYGLNDRDLAKGLMNNSMRSILAIGVGILIIFSFSGKYILSFFGAEFILGSTVLFIFIFSQVINAVFSPCYVFLNFCGEQSFISRLHIYVLIPSVLLTVILTYNQGIIGLGISKLLTTIVLNIAPVIYIKKKLGCLVFTYD